MNILFQYSLAIASYVFSLIRSKLPPFIWRSLDSLLLFMVDLVRLFAGKFGAAGLSKCERPKKPLELYEFEGCPYCRKVREALSVLEIDHIVYPCPRETLRSSGVCLNSRYRPKVKDAGGNIIFPFLIDPNTEKKLYDSDLIVKYLWTTYGSEAVAPMTYKLANYEPFRSFSLKLAMLLRPSLYMGYLRAPSKLPQQPLELWGYESNGAVRRAREILTVLEVPYLYHELPLGSSKRKEFFAQYSDQSIISDVLLLHDPNFNVRLFDENKIVSHLRTNYQTFPIAEDESWFQYGADDAKKKHQ